MKSFLIIILIFLTGCTQIPIKPDFPPPYLDLSTNEMPICGDLKIIPPDVNNLSAVFKIATENYTNYWLCANKVEGWKQWYTDQKKKYESSEK